MLKSNEITTILLSAYVFRSTSEIESNHGVYYFFPFYTLYLCIFHSFTFQQIAMCNRGKVINPRARVVDGNYTWA